MRSKPSPEGGSTRVCDESGKHELHPLLRRGGSSDRSDADSWRGSSHEGDNDRSSTFLSSMTVTAVVAAAAFGGV